MDRSPRQARDRPAACSSSQPGRRRRPPLRCARSRQRVQARHGTQLAIVATAGKLAALCRHLLIKGDSYPFAQPSLPAHKHRRLQLRAGMPPTNGGKGNASGYSRKAVRDAERDLAAQGEAPYRTMVAAWQASRPSPTAAQHQRWRWTWTPATGRDSDSPQAKQRGNTSSPNILLFARRSTTPTAADATAVLAAVKTSHALKLSSRGG